MISFIGLILNLLVSYLNWNSSPRMSGLNLGVALMCIPGTISYGLQAL